MRWGARLLIVVAALLAGVPTPAEAASRPRGTVKYAVSLFGATTGVDMDSDDVYTGRAVKPNGYSRTLLYYGRTDPNYGDYSTRGDWKARFVVVDRDGSRLVLTGGSRNWDSVTYSPVGVYPGIYQYRIGTLKVADGTGFFKGARGTASAELEGNTGHLVGSLVVRLK